MNRRVDGDPRDHEGGERGTESLLCQFPEAAERLVVLLKVGNFFFCPVPEEVDTEWNAITYVLITSDVDVACAGGNPEVERKCDEAA